MIRLRFPRLIEEGVARYMQRHQDKVFPGVVVKDFNPWGIPPGIYFRADDGTWSPAPADVKVS